MIRIQITTELRRSLYRFNEKAALSDLRIMKKTRFNTGSLMSSEDHNKKSIWPLAFHRLSSAIVGGMVAHRTTVC